MKDDVATSQPTPTINQSQSQIPTQIEIEESQKEPEELKTGRSRQQKEMAEIEDILRRAAHVAAVSEKTEKEMALKKALRA